eukprot:2970769-Prymnesium_polylepis.1
MIDPQVRRALVCESRNRAFRLAAALERAHAPAFGHGFGIAMVRGTGWLHSAEDNKDRLPQERDVDMSHPCIQEGPLLLSGRHLVLRLCTGSELMHKRSLWLANMFGAAIDLP